jgi:hypothetical protein
MALPPTTTTSNPWGSFSASTVSVAGGSSSGTTTTTSPSLPTISAGDYFASQTAIPISEYRSRQVNFYQEFLDVPSLADTGIDVGDGEDTTELREYGIAGERGDGGDTQDDAINALEATGIRTGESMFPGGTGISYNTDLETGHHQYNNYSDYIKAENPVGMKDRLGFIENVMEPFVQGRWSDINLSAGFSSQLNSTMGNIEAAVDPTKVSGKTAMKGIFAAAGAPMALVGSVIFSDKTVKNAFGEISARPDGMLGIVADAVHSRQYNDRSINRAVMAAHTTGPMAGEFMTAGDEETDAYGNPVASSRGLTGVDIGFSMQFGSGIGSGGITRRAGTGVYTGNMRGLDNSTLKNMEAIQRGFVPSTFGGTFGFDYTGKDAVRFEDAGYSNNLGNGGRYTANGNYMDGYGRVSMVGRASDLSALASTNGLTVDQAKSALDKARSGKGTVAENIQSIKNEKAADEAAKQAAEQAKQAAASRDRLAQIQQQQYSDSGGDNADSYGGSGVEDAGIGSGFGDFSSGLSHAKGGKVQGYAMGTPPAGVQASQSGFIDAPPSQVTDGAKVADNRPDSVPEGTYIINAAAVEFAGEQDIRKMIMDAQKEAVRRGLSTDDFERHSNLVDIAVSSGEVKIAPHLVDIIGEDRLEKINKRGIRKTEQRIAENGQQPVQAARGGFLA